MNFKDKLQKTFNETRKKEQEEIERRIKNMMRTDEEWEIIKEHIGKCVLEKASRIFRAEEYLGLSGRWISLSTSDHVNFENPVHSFSETEPEKAKFCKEHNIHINWKDMERFCKENELELRYVLNTNPNYAQERISETNPSYKYVQYYLIKVS